QLCGGGSGLVALSPKGIGDSKPSLSPSLSGDDVFGENPQNLSAGIFGQRHELVGQRDRQQGVVVHRTAQTTNNGQCVEQVGEVGGGGGRVQVPGGHRHNVHAVIRCPKDQLVTPVSGPPIY